MGGVLVERDEQGIQYGTNVGAILSGVEVDQIVKAIFGLKDTGVVGKQAEPATSELGWRSRSRT